MEEPPHQDRRSHKHQPKNLVAPENSCLFRPPRLLGLLLEMRLNASLHHQASPGQLEDAPHLIDSMVQRFNKTFG